MELLVFYILLSIGVSFICSILEAVILSITPNYLETVKSKDPVIYRQLRPLREEVEKPLASILTINTFAHTIGAAGAGAQAQAVFGNEWFTVFSIVLTFGILILSEIIPKSIGAHYWKQLAPTASKILPPMIYITYPVVYMSDLIARFFKGDGLVKTSRDEIKAIVEMGLRDGAIEVTEYRILKKLMEFRNLKSEDILTHKSKVTGIFLEDEKTFDKETLLNISYSRLPVFGSGFEDIKGYLLKGELLVTLAKQGKLDPESVVKPMLIVPSYIPVKTVFFRLLDRKEHMCAVVDDFGVFMGIITLENILEALLGVDIVDEFDPE